MKTEQFQTATPKIQISIQEVSPGEWSVKVGDGTGNFTMFPESDQYLARQSAQFLADKIAEAFPRKRRVIRLSLEAMLLLKAKEEGGILRRDRKTDKFQMYVPHGGFANVEEATIRELIRAKRLPKKTLTHYQELK